MKVEGKEEKRRIFHDRFQNINTTTTTVFHQQAMVMQVLYDKYSLRAEHNYNCTHILYSVLYK